MQSHLTTAPDWRGIVTVLVLVALANVAFERWKEHFAASDTAQL
jgi:hypothetical protein